MNPTTIALLTEIRDLLTEIRDHQRANLASQTVLDERRRKDHEHKRLVRKNVCRILQTEKNEEAREEKSPRTPLKGEREEARKDTHTFARAREGFVKPTVAEVAAYCRQRGNFVDPQKWFDFYESKGWLIGKNRMVNWKAAVRTWERNSEHANADTTSAGIRYYHGRPLPPDAPPRPSPTAQWDFATDSWNDFY